MLQSEQKSAEFNDYGGYVLCYCRQDITTNFEDVVSNLHDRLRAVQPLRMPIFSYHNKMHLLMASCSAVMISLLSELAENGRQSQLKAPTC